MPRNRNNFKQDAIQLNKCHCNTKKCEMENPNQNSLCFAEEVDINNNASGSISLQDLVGSLIQPLQHPHMLAEAKSASSLCQIFASDPISRFSTYKNTIQKLEHIIKELKDKLNRLEHDNDSDSTDTKDTNDTFGYSMDSSHLKNDCSLQQEISFNSDESLLEKLILKNYEKILAELKQLKNQDDWMEIYEAFLHQYQVEFLGDMLSLVEKKFPMLNSLDVVKQSFGSHEKCTTDNDRLEANSTSAQENFSLYSTSTSQCSSQVTQVKSTMPCADINLSAGDSRCQQLKQDQNSTVTSPKVTYNNPFDPRLRFRYLKFLSYSPREETREYADENIFMWARREAIALLEEYLHKYRQFLAKLGVTPILNLSLPETKMDNKNGNSGIWLYSKDDFEILYGLGKRVHKTDKMLPSWTATSTNKVNTLQNDFLCKPSPLEDAVRRSEKKTELGIKRKLWDERKAMKSGEFSFKYEDDEEFLAELAPKRSTSFWDMPFRFDSLGSCKSIRRKGAEALHSLSATQLSSEFVASDCPSDFNILKDKGGDAQGWFDGFYHKDNVKNGKTESIFDLGSQGDEKNLKVNLHSKSTGQLLEKESNAVDFTESDILRGSKLDIFTNNSDKRRQQMESYNSPPLKAIGDMLRKNMKTNESNEHSKIKPSFDLLLDCNPIDKWIFNNQSGFSLEEHGERALSNSDIEEVIPNSKLNANAKDFSPSKSKLMERNTANSTTVSDIEKNCKNSEIINTAEKAHAYICKENSQNLSLKHMSSFKGKSSNLHENKVLNKLSVEQISKETKNDCSVGECSTNLVKVSSDAGTGNGSNVLSSSVPASTSPFKLIGLQLQGNKKMSENQISKGPQNQYGQQVKASGNAANPLHSTQPLYYSAGSLPNAQQLLFNPASSTYAPYGLAYAYPTNLPAGNFQTFPLPKTALIPTYNTALANHLSPLNTIVPNQPNRNSSLPNHMANVPNSYNIPRMMQNPFASNPSGNVLYPGVVSSIQSPPSQQGLPYLATIQQVMGMAKNPMQPKQY